MYWVISHTISAVKSETPQFLGGVHRVGRAHRVLVERLVVDLESVRAERGRTEPHVPVPLVRTEEGQVDAAVASRDPTGQQPINPRQIGADRTAHHASRWSGR